jgi:hypothetical protein
VIVHEIPHVSVPNHGKLWKSLMRAHLGNHERFEEELENEGVKQSAPGGRCAVRPITHTASFNLTLIASFSACARSCFVPR